ncbi:MAG TPA: MFS transporter [Propionicimonas sp.]|uniref:MFS transporter n=1 Tax=Propionicimonas sp. TaxID=1955623 RepID=UPI002F3FB4F8
MDVEVAGSGGERRTGGPWWTGVAFRVNLAMANVGFYVSSIGVVIVVLAGDLGLPLAQLAWVGSTFGYGLLAMALAGPFVLKLGPNRVLALSAAALGIGSVLLAFSAGAMPAYVGAVLQGVGAAGLVLVSPGLVHGADAEKKLTQANAAASVAGILAPLLLGLAAVTRLGGRLPLLLMAAAMAVLAVVAFLAGREQQAAEHVATEAPPTPLSRWETARRWLALVSAVAVEFCFVVWGVARLTTMGIDRGQAALIATAFPLGMAVGRLLGSWLISKLPMVTVGAAVTAGGTLMVVLVDNWFAVGLGQFLAGLGLATLYPILLARLMHTPGLRPELGASLGALASGTAITVAPAVLAVLATVVDLRIAFLLPLPILILMLFLYGRPHQLVS